MLACLLLQSQVRPLSSSQNTRNSGFFSFFFTCKTSGKPLEGLLSRTDQTFFSQVSSLLPLFCPEFEVRKVSRAQQEVSPKVPEEEGGGRVGKIAFGIEV